MFPCFIFNNCVNSGLMNRKNYGDVFLSKQICFIKLNNFKNFIRCQFVARTFFSNRRTFPISHIGTILFRCSKIKMFWIDASSIIAMVTYKKSVWNIAIMKLIRKSMRTIQFAINSYIAISFFAFPANPFPTIRSFLYKFPEPFYGIDAITMRFLEFLHPHKYIIKGDYENA